VRPGGALLAGVQDQEVCGAAARGTPQRMRARPVSLAALTVCLLMASCSGGSAGPAAPTVHRTGGAPGCGTAVATGSGPSSAGVSLRHMPGSPFGVAVTADGRWTFLSLTRSVAVLRNGPHGPSLVRTIAVPQPEALGDALTRDGRYLLVALGSGALVINVARAENGQPHAVLGMLSNPGRSAGSAIEVVASPDGRYAFVSLEYNDEIAVFRLSQAVAHGFGRPEFVGDIPAGQGVVGMAVSPDGRWLYATSEIARGTSLAHVGNASGVGTLQVMSIPRAETDPSRSVVATVTAGCQPVRVITSADGSTVWVTARASDALLAFSAARLRSSQPGHALLGWTRVGEAPVGLALVRGGTELVVADSNRFSAPGAASTLAVVRARAVLAGKPGLAGKPALAGYVRAGGFPREMALEPGGRTLLIGNFSSGQLESVTVADLP
jgi:DNA-binding beta-propeller fold protein YncE